MPHLFQSPCHRLSHLNTQQNDQHERFIGRSVQKPHPSQKDKGACVLNPHAKKKEDNYFFVHTCIYCCWVGLQSDDAAGSQNISRSLSLTLTSTLALTAKAFVLPYPTASKLHMSLDYAGRESGRPDILEEQKTFATSRKRLTCTSWMVGIDEVAPPAWPSQTNCCSWTTRDAVTLARFVATKGCLGCDLIKRGVVRSNLHLSAVLRREE